MFYGVEQMKNKLLESLLQRLLEEKYGEAFIGDIHEVFMERAAVYGRISARLWLWGQVLVSLVSLIKRQVYWSVTMFKSYFLMAFRNLQKHLSYTLISILGLALGLSAAILILNYLQFEMSYDRFHKDADNIYRVCIRHLKEGDLESESHIFTPPIGEDMKKDFPEVEDFVRFSQFKTLYMNIDNTAYKEMGIRYASSGFFQMFSFKLKVGDPAEVLKTPYSVVLTESTALRIFGTKDPLGTTIQIGEEELYQVTGIAEDPPPNSTIQYSSLISFSTLYLRKGMHMGWNGGNQYITHVKLREGTHPAAVEAKFPAFLWTYINETIAPFGWKYEAYLQPVKKIHFHYDASSRTALTNFYTFSAIAVFILIIACINFVNLTTARAARRAREVGLRKVVGAHRGNLIRQFLGESVAMVTLAFIAGIGLVVVLAPTYNQLLNKDMSIFSNLNLWSILGLAGLILVVGIASGLYPAFYLSSFQPVKTLKGIGDSGRGKKTFQNALVIFQFAISVTLIICTLLIRNQLSFIKKVELGYDKENIVVVPIVDNQMRAKSSEMRSRLLSVRGVVQVSASSAVPYRGFTSNGYVPEGRTKSIMIHALDVDEYFLETFDIKVIRGRNFSQDFATDRDALLINETLARQLGWDNPIGKIIHRNEDRQVIGLVQDFKFDTLHDEVAPLLITNNPWGNRFNVISIKVASDDLRATMAGIEKVYKEFSPLIPFEYFFLDAAFDQLYRSEERFNSIFLYFSILAIAIALLGLFSLSAYSAQQKAKEIGIRKVLGASTANILSLFSKEVIGLILIANVVAWAAAFYIINRWLLNFAYRGSLSLTAFLLATAGSVLAALATISFQSLKAAFRNPVDELRSE